MLVLLMGCLHDSDNAIGPVTVPLEVSEMGLMQNTECFDNIGAVNANAYVFSGTIDKLDDFSGTIDDIDNIAPDPIETVSITQKQGSNYIYEVVFNDEGSYRVAVTCESNLDDPAVDDNIRFISAVSVRTGRINDVSVDVGFPSFHLNTTTDCSGCHALGTYYDIAVVNHDYVVGVCLDCHTSP